MIPEYTSCQEGCSGIPFFTVLMTVYRVVQRQAIESLIRHIKLASTAFADKALSLSVRVALFPARFVYDRFL